MKYFTKLAEEAPKDLKVTKSPLWMHEAGTSRADAIKKDFDGMAFTSPNSPMLSDTTTTTFTGDGSNPLFKKDHKYEQQIINHLSYNEDGVSGMKKSDMYETGPDGKKRLTSSDQGGSGSKSNAISKEDAIKSINKKKDARGLKKDSLDKESSLNKEAAPVILAPILGGLARILGMGAVRAGGAAVARGAAGAGTRALATTGAGGAGGAAGGSWWSNLLKPT